MGSLELFFFRNHEAHEGQELYLHFVFFVVVEGRPLCLTVPHYREAPAGDGVSAPFPYELIASNTVDRVAWVFYNKGKRNIWFADGPSFEPQQLTEYVKDDGQEISQLTFSMDGANTAYVRGGEPNRAKEYPIPTQRAILGGQSRSPRKNEQPGRSVHRTAV